MVEVVSTTFADIIDVFQKYQQKYQQLIGLGGLIFYIINSISPKNAPFPSCLSVVVFLAVNYINYKLQLRLLHIATTNSWERKV